MKAEHPYAKITSWLEIIDRVVMWWSLALELMPPLHDFLLLLLLQLLSYFGGFTQPDIERSGS